MRASLILNRLHGVKRTGSGRWIARCPAHEDRNPSLAIRELEDGRMLLHDFAGCATTDVLAAVGLTLEDLFPERPVSHHGQKEGRPFYAIDVLRCIAFEALIVSIAAHNLVYGVELAEADRKRLLVAASRLEAATEVCDG